MKKDQWKQKEKRSRKKKKRIRDEQKKRSQTTLSTIALFYLSRKKKV